VGEKFLTNTYTVAITYQALLVAADFAELFEHPDDALHWRETAAEILEASSRLIDSERNVLSKGYLLQEDGSFTTDTTLDISSLYGVIMFGLHSSASSSIQSTVLQIESVLLDQSPSGGSPRYEHDHYFESSPSFQGNPWFVTTLWMAQYYLRTGNRDKAIGYIDWTLKHALPSGVLSEQINPENGEPISVTPLVWSHAELINTVLDLSATKSKD